MERKVRSLVNIKKKLYQRIEQASIHFLIENPTKIHKLSDSKDINISFTCVSKIS